MSEWLCPHKVWHYVGDTAEPCDECSKERTKLFASITNPSPVRDGLNQYRLNSEVDAIDAAVLASQQRMMIETVDPLHVKIQELERALKEVTKQFKIEETTDDGVIYLEWTIRSTGVYVGVMPTYYRWMKGEL